jgi:hypothetical protein
MARIVIYGGELAGIAAALTASRRAATGTEVVLIFPEGAPGGAATVGGHCAWERREWQHGERRADPHGGNFAVWLEEVGPVYSPGAFAARLSDELADAGIRVLAGHDLEAVMPQGTGATGGRSRSRAKKAKAGPLSLIGSVRVRPLVAAGHGLPAFADSDPEDIQGDVFIDASATGRLARLAGVPLSIGRADWNPDGRQMAATLLFAIENVDWDALAAARDAQDRPVWGTATETSPDGTHRVFWGGASIAANDPILQAFAQAHPHFRLGALRAWEESGGVFWVSGLLCYNVDGRRRAYDAGTERDTDPVPLMSRDLDTAYREARELGTGSDTLGALRRFPGLGQVRFAELGGVPRCGDVLFLRETVHAPGAGPDGFAVNVEDLTGAGVGSHDGLDIRHRPRRVGLGFYWLENVGYTHGELLRTTAAATNPAYLPLDAILVPPVQNLLVPGYAARIESRAWWALRTAPNQCVLGDAAGVAAAFSAREGMSVLRFGNPEIAAVQSWLREEGAILDKW